MKSEINEFIDCNPSLNVEDVGEEEFYNPEVKIKSEDNQIEPIDDANFHQNELENSRIL